MRQLNLRSSSIFPQLLTSSVFPLAPSAVLLGLCRLDAADLRPGILPLVFPASGDITGIFTSSETRLKPGFSLPSPVPLVSSPHLLFS